MGSFNLQFLYCVIIIALGYLLKRGGIIKEKDGEGLSRIIFNITLPTLIIVTFHDIKIETSLFLLILMGFLYGIFIGFFALFLFRKKQRNIKGMLGMMVPGFNIGLFAYPLVEVIFGKEGLTYFGMFDVGNAFIVFGLSYLIGSFYSKEDVKLDPKTVIIKLSKSIPLMTYIIVVIVNLIGLQIPSTILNVAEIISAANMPLSLLLLGIYLNFTFDKSYIKLMVQFLGVRYGIGLLIGVSCFFLLPFDDMFKYTLLMGFLLPTSVSVLPYSVEFEYDQKFVGTLSNITIILSFIILWVLANLLISS
ncbi:MULTISPECIES: AEC family transporter [Bacillaceae]|uniref:AEC family transporter n=1 Tax=Bacillaceae TaxID=186817 RepID=UPI000BFBB674|nr:MULTISPECIES: AEC family transporter [Bacillaceae]PGT91610.1 malonate transporter [Bacillus sp. AFS040349]UGB28971.1 AEC family transporter [Metabacillus sp. B2-18]